MKLDDIRDGLLINLLLGKIGERIFLRSLEEIGDIEYNYNPGVEHVDRRYGIVNFDILRSGEQIAHSNVKVHAAKLRKAKEFVNLEPFETELWTLLAQTPLSKFIFDAGLHFE